eukprot:gene16991-20220_t
MFKNPDTTFESGITVGGVHYLCTKADDYSIYGKKDKGGVCYAKTNDCVIIGVYKKKPSLYPTIYYATGSKVQTINVSMIYAEAFHGPSDELFRYRYLKANVPTYVTLFQERHVIRLCNLELFDERYSGLMTKRNRTDIRESINAMYADCINVSHGQERPSRLEFIGLLERALIACAMDAEEVDRIMTVRTRVRSLTSTLTPVKETYLAMLGFLEFMDTRDLRGVNVSSFEFIIEWRDLELNQYITRIFGFSRICTIGTLDQVVAAHHQTGGDLYLSMDNDDIQVLRYIHDNLGSVACKDTRLLEEDNPEVIRFIMETYQTPMRISKRFLFQKERIDVLKYLAITTHQWIDADALEDEQPVEDGVDDMEPIDVYCRSLEMMQYLVETRHNFNRVRVEFTQESDLPMIELYHRHLVRIHQEDMVKDSAKSMMPYACSIGLPLMVKYIHSVHPEKIVNGAGRFTFIDMALAAGHMDIVSFILANRSEKFQHWSWRTAAAANDIELYEYVRANTDGQSNDNDLTSTLGSCFQYDHYHLLEYYLSTFKQLENTPIISRLISNSLLVFRLGCLQVLINHLPANYYDPILNIFVESLPAGTIKQSLNTKRYE